MANRYKKYIYYLILIIIVIDLYHSFRQHYYYDLDGDIPESTLPYETVKPTLQDPLGVKTILNQEKHLGPNRFFSHYLENRYMNICPKVFQTISDPLHSVYLSCAFLKIIIQILLIYLLTVFTFNDFFPFKKIEHLFIILLFSSCFQTVSRVREMGIIDPAITYTFFYALPFLFLLLYLLPFIFKEFYNKNLIKKQWIKVLWCIVFLLLSQLSGPTNPGIAVVFIIVILIRYTLTYHRNNANHLSVKSFFKNIPKSYYVYLLPLCIMAIYSLYLGTYNSAYDTPPSLSERYSLLLKGLGDYFIFNKSMSILTAICIVNSVLIKIFSKKESKKVLPLFFYIILFTIIYIVLLPFGGYRPYRPYIIRYDSVLAITFLFIFYWGFSSCLLLKSISTSKATRTAFIIYTFISICYFFILDINTLKLHSPEVRHIKQIQKSEDLIVPLENNDWSSNIISWEPAYEPWQSENPSKCLQRWGVIKEDKRWYLKKTE